ncbi:MAG: ATP-binding protein, partial [Bacteroidota bacterium]
NHLQIHLTRHRNILNLIVEDDGQGMEVGDGRKNGLGLQNIQERIKNLKGELHIDAQPGRGTSISIDIPVLKAKNLV